MTTTEEDQNRERKKVERAKAMQELMDRLKEIAGKKGEEVMVEAMIKSNRHETFNTLFASWGMSIPESISFMIEYTIGAAVLAKQDHASVDEVLDAIESVWKHKMTVARAKAQVLGEMLGEFEKTRERKP